MSAHERDYRSIPEWMLRGVPGDTLMNIAEISESELIAAGYLQEDKTTESEG